MINTHKNKLVKYKWLVFSIWTLLMVALLLNNLAMLKDASQNLAIKEARTHFQKDKVFRYWSAMHGGFYVPIDERTTPSPYLEHIPERDMQSPDGKKLTLMNPAWALRQMNEDYAEIFGVVGHITSLHPLRTENAPDDWESQALDLFELGETEVLEFFETGDSPSLRLMQPLITVEGCLKCHGHQGYEVGDVRGGVSVSVPLDVYFAQKNRVSKTQINSFTLVWFLGIGVIIFGFNKANKNRAERVNARMLLQESHDSLETKVKERTKTLKKTNTELNSEIVDRKKAEKKLQTSEEKYRSLFDSMKESFALHKIILDKNNNPKDYTFIEVNDAFENQTGLKRKDIIGKNVTKILPGIKKDPADWIGLYGKVAMTGKEIKFDQYSQPLKRWYSILAYSPQESYFATIFIDITDKKLADEELTKYREHLEELIDARTVKLQEQNLDLNTKQKELEEANRLKSEFLSNMSHELRTPLNSIMSLSHVLSIQTKDRLSSEENSYFEVVNRNSKKLLELVSEILDLSKIEAGKVDIVTGKISVGELLDTIKDSLTPLAEEKGITLNLKLPKKLPTVVTDEVKLHQVFTNVIGNAVKFTEKGSVDIISKSDSKNVYVDIKDTGIGISEEELPHIFDEFRQVDGSSTRRYEGTGLGLAIAYKTIKLLGGTIRVISKLDNGSVFTITTPIKWTGRGK